MDVFHIPQALIKFAADTKEGGVRAASYFFTSPMQTTRNLICRPRTHICNGCCSYLNWLRTCQVASDHRRRLPVLQMPSELDPAEMERKRMRESIRKKFYMVGFLYAAARMGYHSLVEYVNCERVRADNLAFNNNNNDVPLTLPSE